ncbi:MAG: carboxymuconolactone decarboxylase family protein [Polyangiaceae bacterium]|nr:carboxymuconolactone decarboxylase family protein [Polyangiaceae bacterium]MCB9605873.1 carboxymuconolactone decarboxylase family protein [Polyangiaceae bacterium]
MQPRIEPLTEPFSDSVAEDLRRLMPPGIPPLKLFRVLAHNPRVLGRVRRGGLLDPGSISLRQREIVILRATARAGAEYEWGVHAMFFGAAANLGSDQLAQLTCVPIPAEAFSEAERALVALVDELHETSDVSEDVWLEASRHFDAEQLVECVVLAGLYRMVSYVVNALKVPLEEAAMRFPADTGLVAKVAAVEQRG